MQQVDGPGCPRNIRPETFLLELILIEQREFLATAPESSNPTIQPGSAAIPKVFLRLEKNGPDPI